MSLPPSRDASSPPAVVRLTAGVGGGPTLADLKTLTLGHLEGGAPALVLDLRAAGPIDRRAVGTLMYVLALYHEAGGRLSLRVSAEQRADLASHARLFHFLEEGEEVVAAAPPAATGPGPPSPPRPPPPS